MERREFAPRLDPNEELNIVIEKWGSVLTHVTSNPETATLLNRLKVKAKREYPEDKEWLARLKSIQTELENTDDEDEIKEILITALGEENREDLDEEDDDDIETEEEEGL